MLRRCVCRSTWLIGGSLPHAAAMHAPPMKAAAWPLCLPQVHAAHGAVPSDRHQQPHHCHPVRLPGNGAHQHMWVLRAGVVGMGSKRCALLRHA